MISLAFHSLLQSSVVLLLKRIKRYKPKAVLFLLLSAISGNQAHISIKGIVLEPDPHFWPVGATPGQYVLLCFLARCTTLELENL